ncbi:MAG: L-fucose:H+ symporter permease [Caulobacteraceae bacterium]
MSAEATPRRAIAPMIMIVSLFFLWGVANNLNDVLVAHFRKAFSLTDLQSGLVQSAFYLGYFVFALPAATFAQRFGYKMAVVLGLTLYGVGALLFYPASEARTYVFFLGALFVIASGLAFLETCANPLMTVLGPSHGAERRLNLAQAFNPLGAIAGVLVGRAFILSGIDPTPAMLSAMAPQALEQFRIAQAHAAGPPYLVLGAIVLVWAGVTALVRFPIEASAPTQQAGRSLCMADFKALLSRKRFLFGVLAQFAYVGAQTGVWSFLIRYTRSALPASNDKLAAGYLTASLVAFMVGRFSGTALMARVKASKLLALFGAVNIALCLVAAFVGGPVGLYALVATSFFMSVMYPTIFAGAIAGLGALTKLGSSFLVMAIVGGAVLPAVMGRISDMSSINTAMVVPALAFALVATFAVSGRPVARVRLVKELPV